MSSSPENALGDKQSILLYVLVKLWLHCPEAFHQSASLTKPVQNERGRSGFEAFFWELCRRRNFSFGFHPILSRAELETRSLTCSPARLVGTALRWLAQL